MWDKNKAPTSPRGGEKGARTESGTFGNGSRGTPAESWGNGGVGRRAKTPPSLLSPLPLVCFVIFLYFCSTNINNQTKTNINHETPSHYSHHHGSFPRAIHRTGTKLRFHSRQRRRSNHLLQNPQRRRKDMRGHIHAHGRILHLLW